MGVVKDTVDALAITLKNLFRKPITVQYPAETRPLPERYKGISFALTHDPETGEENCIGCRLCEFICPSNVISVTQVRRGNRTYAETFYLDLSACLICELCVQVCPTDAIVMIRKGIDEPVYNRADLVLTKEKMEANEKRFSLSWTTGNRLRQMQAPPRRRPAARPAAASNPEKKEGGHG